MATKIDRKGFGQVEPNHLSAQTNGQIYAQLPASTAVGKILENGRFLKYDYAAGVCDCSTAASSGEWMLVFNEVKLYDPRKQAYKDYAMKSEDFMGGTMVPRLLKTSIGDIFTTNTFGANTADSLSTTAGPTLSVGNYVAPGADGYLATASAPTTATSPSAAPIFVVVKEYNLGDMQPAVKLQRVF